MDLLETLARDPESWETPSFFVMAGAFALFEWLRPARKVDHLAHLKLDLLAFAVTVLVNQITIRSLSAVGSALGPEPALVPLAPLSELPSIARIAVAVVIVDFAIYWIHRAQHRFGWAWRTHRWHHSTEQLYWFSGFRVSFMHSLLYNVPQTFAPMLILGLSPIETGIGYAIAMFVQFWEHTNLRVNIGPLRFIFVTPQYHRVHHSSDRFMHKNIGTTFSLWDVLFGTYIDPESIPDSFPLGMGESWQKKQLPRLFLGV